MPKAPSEPSEGFDINSAFDWDVPRFTHTRGLELLYVLANLTLAEEAGIRQISPLIGLMKLKYGNFGKKGSVSFVRIDSKLGLILPNMPEDVVYLLFERKAKDDNKTNKDSGIKSFKGRRAWVLRALQLLVSTGLEVWQRIKISPERLAEWPEDGCVLTNVQRISSDELPDEHQDTGPSPFQNPHEEEVEYYATEPNDFPIDASEKVKSAREEFEAVFAETQLPTVNIEGTRARMQQSEVLPTAGFVDMLKEPYAWALAYPTLFPPQLINGKFYILGDFTGNPFHIRDQTVELREWAEWNMWRSDGEAVKHPTFSLAVEHEITQRSLFGQGRVCLARNDIGYNVTLGELREKTKNNDSLRKLEESINYAAGNVKGTDQYNKKLLGEYQATAFYHNYSNDSDMRYFLTGSQAEFSDPYLRRLLSKYVAIVVSQEEGQRVLEDDTVFFKAVGNYKNVVTHFFAYKQECWLNTILHNCFGIEDYFGIYEFAKGRGAIHTHGSGFANTDVDKEIDEFLAQYAIGVFCIAEEVEEFIAQRYTKASGEVNPLLVKFPKDKAKKVRQDFLSQTVEGKALWKKYESELTRLNTEASKGVNLLMECHFGFSAFHIGQAPNDWIKPGGAKESLGYRLTHPDMLSKEDIFERGTLREFKFCQEVALSTRRVWVCNQCFTHKCSGYCWKPTFIVCDYDPEVHGSEEDNPMIESVFSTDGGNERVKLKVFECKMRMGFKLKYPRDGDQTGGAPRVDTAYIGFDKNGQPKYYAERNHPRIVQEPVAVYHFGANCDIQRFLTNSRTFQVSFKMLCLYQ
jgi:hypothetical protein